MELLANISIAVCMLITAFNMYYMCKPFKSKEEEATNEHTCMKLSLYSMLFLVIGVIAKISVLNNG